MTRTRPALPNDAGETLLEVLVALVIMSIAVVAVVGGLVNFISISDLHRKQASAGTAVRDYAEAVAGFANGTGYVSCAGASAYPPGAVGYSAPTGFAASVQAVSYWTGTAWSSSCGTDLGLQKVTVQVASSDGRASEQAVVMVRRACGIGSTCTS